jgi:acyl-CoA thioesterase FadM
MPLTDLAISYLAPARYDDLLSVHVGVAELSYARLRLRLPRHRRAGRPRRSAGAA